MDILIRPIVTEKLTRLGEKLQQYGFIVDQRAHKLQIKKAIEELYGVKVDTINTMRYSGKLKSRPTKRRYVVGRTSAYKKAIVTLKDGQTIDFYSNI